VLDVLIFLQDGKPEDVEDVLPPEASATAAREKAEEGGNSAAESKAEIRPVPDSLSKKLPETV
jgi:hypothetical protein